ncbi:unnamed protein product [Microthlaspi erraticum]|uniref:Retrotransposon gag domain-containing protein n=1 Tax=Microthlaspi erraticum TaxID=1685480 RepID=A0A6D2IMS6_9BRAS|nr:unnamed protein product [Microthlaspi erraticum]
MSSIPDIDKVIRETQRTPFSSRITNTYLRDTYKLCIPEYSGNSDPRAYIRALYLEILRAQFFPKEIAENLAGPAKNWFATLDENSIDTFDQLLSVFINQYSIFIEPEVSEADLWTLSQAPNESLRSYVNRFKAIIAKIENPNEAVALLAFRNNLVKRKARLAKRNKTSSNDNDKASQKRERKVGINHQESPLSKKKRSDSTQHLESSAHAAAQ